jgi:hypothetical protein
MGKKNKNSCRILEKGGAYFLIYVMECQSGTSDWTENQ